MFIYPIPGSIFKKHECTICMQHKIAFYSTSLLICNHTFCKRCLSTWKYRQSHHNNVFDCPICRTPIIQNSKDISNMIKIFTEKFFDKFTTLHQKIDMISHMNSIKDSKNGNAFLSNNKSIHKSFFDTYSLFTNQVKKLSKNYII